jgi:hypothetical protein
LVATYTFQSTGMSRGKCRRRRFGELATRRRVHQPRVEADPPVVALAMVGLAS